MNVQRVNPDELTHEVRCALIGTEVRIWSGEHRAWWRPAASGYTKDPADAGVYPFSEAWRMLRGRGPEKRLALDLINTTKGN